MKKIMQMFAMMMVMASVTTAIAAINDSSWRGGPSKEWFVNWDKALAEAKKTGKKLFVLNTGSDWCGWCKRLRANVLDQSEFEDFAKKNLVLLYLDSPSRNPLSKEQSRHNRQVVKFLGFGGGVPQVEIFSADGMNLGRIGGGGDSLDVYLDKLDKIISEDGEPVGGDRGKMLFSGGYAKLAAQIAEERAKLPPVDDENDVASNAPAVSKSVAKGWTEDFEAAKKKAAKEGKLILMDFSGSDWCGWCKKMDEEVFAKDRFVREASKKFVLVMIDSPNDKTILSNLAKRQNQELKETYSVRGFPTVVIVDPSGKEVKRHSGYRAGGPGGYIKYLRELTRGVKWPKKSK